jgi:transcriptional regulator with XRE-family HTH domain
MLTISNFQISLALHAVRERCKFSAETLGLLAGLAPDVVSRIEAGEIALDYLTAARLTQALQVSLAEIALAAHALDPAMVRGRYVQMAAVLRRREHD